MGDPSRLKKQYSRPRKPWDRTRLEKERAISKEYGLKTKRELWRIEATLRQKRQSARKLLALPLEKRLASQKELVNSLHTMGVVKADAGLDDILGLEIKEFLERRLQTMVVRKGLASTMSQARQFITHGHIAVNAKRVSSPSYLTRKNDQLAYYGKPLVIQQAPKVKVKPGKKEFEEAIPNAEEAPVETTEPTATAETEKIESTQEGS
ncbi:MAG: 30S ribosomal protein S4 [Candidatus Micrarchaeota archaeon]